MLIRITIIFNDMITNQPTNRIIIINTIIINRIMTTIITIIRIVMIVFAVARKIRSLRLFLARFFVSIQ